jgi:uncharacterized protein (TIGR03086 family)
MSRTWALPGWDVHELVRHIVGCASFFADTAEMGVCRPEEREWPDYAAGDINEAFALESGRLLKAFAAPGVMDKEMSLPSGPASGSLCVLVAVGEIFVHGWDLAKAIGQSTDPGPAVSECLRSSAWADLCDVVRANEPPAFAQPVPVPEGAPPADALAAFLGRTP